MSKAKTLDDFRAAHDPNVIVPSKIQAGLAAILKEGPENWDYEIDFLRRTGLSVTQLATFRDQFAKYIVEAPASHGKTVKRCYFGDPKVAAKLRGV